MTIVFSTSVIRRFVLIFSVMLFVFACYKKTASDEELEGEDSGMTSSDGEEFDHPRHPTFSEDAIDYEYYEGVSADNRCSTDTDCQITGCINSTCAAETVEIEDESFCYTRSMSSWQMPFFSHCGCMSGECQWYFENDYDRDCIADTDCRGLGPPLNREIRKRLWECWDNKCLFGGPDSD